MLNLIDGFDVLAIAFAAPSLATDWKLAPDALGVLLSAGLVGMARGDRSRSAPSKSQPSALTTHAVAA